MYKNPSGFTPPVNHSGKIWKCFNFFEFIKMLNLNSLSFVNTKEFSSNNNIEVLIKNYIKNTKKWNYFINRINPIYGNFESNILKDYIKTFEEIKSKFFMSSWYMSDYESAAMWDICLKENKHIMIQSSFDKLVKAFESNSLNSIWISTINYLDYTSTIFDNINFLSLLITKRKSFEYQNELVVITKDENVTTHPFISKKKKYNNQEDEHDLNVNINLDILIENIYLSHFIPDYESDIIESLLQKFDLQCRNRIVRGERNMF